jgi:hypothetical protein
VIYGNVGQLDRRWRRQLNSQRETDPDADVHRRTVLEAEDERRQHHPQPREEHDPLFPFRERKQGCERDHRDRGAVRARIHGSGATGKRKQPRRHEQHQSEDKLINVEDRFGSMLRHGFLRQGRVQTLRLNAMSETSFFAFAHATLL